MAALVLSCLPWQAVATEEIWVSDLSGSIDIAPDGSVEDVKLSPSLGKQIDVDVTNSILKWRFEPIVEDGRAVPARAKLRITLEARGQSDNLKVGFRNIGFYDPPKYDVGPPAHHRPELSPPSYPIEAAKEGAGADLYVIVEFAEDGTVSRAAVERIDVMPTYARVANDLAKLGMRFEKAALKAIQGWRYPPEWIKSMDGRTARIPVRFRMRDQAWSRIYELGKRDIPWLNVSQAPLVANVSSNGEMGSKRIVLLNRPTEGTAL
ncbi:MAG TPA: energy transducer TonB [Pseudoxanthomonas sp.]